MYYLMKLNTLTLFCYVAKPYGITKLCHVIILNSESYLKPV